MELPNPDDIATQCNIIVLKNGAIMFNLPQDGMLAYGLLHLAMDQVQARMAGTMKAEAPSRIVTLQ